MAWNKHIFMVVLFMMAISALAQENRYVVFFKDKTGSPYSISNPAEFLSQRSVNRRIQQGIAVNENDLPVNESYVNNVQGTGAEVYFRSRWMNALLIQCDQSLLESIQNLSCVERVEFVAPGYKLSNGRKRSSVKNKTTKASEVTDEQLAMIGLDVMQAEGLKGEGVSIGIFDSGFMGVNVTDPFSHARDEGHINLELSHDFVFNTDNVFQYDEHGGAVFSIIAAYQPGTFTGGAYEADYQLYVTEDVSSEYRIEEYNWVFAAERADSAGVDIISSSLGYYNFDDASMNYPKSAMDGKTTVVSRAAQWAADRGIIVICSAGNEGANSWQTITAPADARDVLAVGGVNSGLTRVNSSSKGPSADGRVKPDVMALGQSTSIILPSGNTGVATGTSLAAPLVTSLAAGLRQKFPELTSLVIIEAIRNSASQSTNPDAFLGYGIPNFSRVTKYIEQLEKNTFEVYPNPVVADSLIIKPYDPNQVSSCQMELVNSQGQIIQQKSLSFSTDARQFTVDMISCSAGLYFIRLWWNGKVFVYKIVKV
ncbi:MAG TPA: S8 family peptidase [Ohtaekwangia sp.]